MNEHLGINRQDVEPLQRSDLLQRAGGALAEGDSYFRMVLDVIPAAIYLTDPNGLITYFNEAAAALWGHRPELGKDLWCGSWKLYWPDGTPLPHDQCPMAQALKEQRPILGAEAIAERPDGTRVPFIPFPTPLFDASGTLIGGVNMLVDITDRKRDEEHARRLAAVVESSDDAIVSQDLDSVITSWNRGAERLFGYTADEIIGQPVTVLIPLDRQDEEREILQSIHSGQSLDQYETLGRHKNGGLVDISLTASPVPNAAGKILGASKIYRNITDRKRAEDYAQRLASIIEFSDDAIISKDLNGVIMSWNHGAERLFGYTADEVIGKPITILMPPERQDEEPKILQRIRRGEAVDHYETVRQRKDGSLVDISLTASPVKNAAGKITGASKIARNISDRKRAEEQQTLLLREMDHRVKNLFAVSSGVVSLSARSAETAQELARVVCDRLGALARAHALTLRGIFSDAGQATTLHALAGTIVSPFEGRTDKHRARVVISGPDIPISGGMVTSFALLLHEFATNAAKYGALSTPDGTIDIECSETSDRFNLTWRERGGPPIIGPTEGEGFGSLLVRTAVRGQLGGEITRDWDPEGLTIHLFVVRDRLIG